MFGRALRIDIIVHSLHLLILFVIVVPTFNGKGGENRNITTKGYNVNDLDRTKSLSSSNNKPLDFELSVGDFYFFLLMDCIKFFAGKVMFIILLLLFLLLQLELMFFALFVSSGQAPAFFLLIFLLLLLLLSLFLFC